DCGFNDSTYFSKQFKRRFSVTPRKYRADKRKF
ncbi:MAG: AraC family transcriptional regulator, partial [Oscillospiraceae bacterium]|nr:AraC family transcriptional regulator [Oscillospiraceae bacterium]